MDLAVANNDDNNNSIFLNGRSGNQLSTDLLVYGQTKLYDDL